MASHKLYKVVAEGRPCDYKGFAPKGQIMPIVKFYGSTRKGDAMPVGQVLSVKLQMAQIVFH
jgi:hypothetical protein